MQILNVTGLKKVYTTRFGGSQVTALRQVDFSVEEGEYVAIMGESGSGKTTLLNIIGGLDRYDSGDLVINADPWTYPCTESRAERRLCTSQPGFCFHSKRRKPAYICDL